MWGMLWAPNNLRKEIKMVYQYFEKYDEYNPGTQYVHDRSYTVIAENGITGNIVACPGRDIPRYISYCDKIKTKSLWTGYFFEIDPQHYKTIKEVLDSQFPEKNIIPVNGDILTYDVNPKYHSSNASALIEDLCIGTSIADLLPFATARLNRQSRRTKIISRKVQMISTSLRNISHVDTIKYYQQYLKIIDTRIKTINGLSVSNYNNAKCCMTKKYGKVIKEYKQTNGNNGKVYEHVVELEGSRHAEMKLYTYMSGSCILHSQLMYN